MLSASKNFSGVLDRNSPGLTKEIQRIKFHSRSFIELSSLPPKDPPKPLESLPQISDLTCPIFEQLAQTERTPRTQSPPIKRTQAYHPTTSSTDHSRKQGLAPRLVSHSASISRNNSFNNLSNQGGAEPKGPSLVREAIQAKHKTLNRIPLFAKTKPTPSFDLNDRLSKTLRSAKNTNSFVSKLDYRSKIKEVNSQQNSIDFCRPLSKSPIHFRQNTETTHKSIDPIPSERQRSPIDPCNFSKPAEMSKAPTLPPPPARPLERYRSLYSTPLFEASTPPRIRQVEVNLDNPASPFRPSKPAGISSSQPRAKNFSSKPQSVELGKKLCSAKKPARVVEANPALERQRPARLNSNPLLKKNDKIYLGKHLSSLVNRFLA